MASGPHELRFVGCGAIMRLPPRPGLAQQWTRTASPPSTGLHMMHISTGRCMQVSKQSGSVRDGHQGSRGHQPRGHPWQRPGIQNRKTTHLRPACLSGCPGSAQQWTRTAPPPSTSLHMMHINTGRGMRMSKQSCSVRDGHQGSPGHHTAPWQSLPQWGQPHLGSHHAHRRSCPGTGPIPRDHHGPWPCGGTGRGC